MRHLSGLVALGILLCAHAAYAECNNGPDENAQDCLSQELRDSDARINASYKAIMEQTSDSEKKQLRDDQRAWLKNRDQQCKLDTTISVREAWIQSILADPEKTLCVVRYTFSRVTELNNRMAKDNIAPASLPAGPQAPQFDTHATIPAAVSDEMTYGDEGYAALSKLSRNKGKWYFEVTIDSESIARSGDVLLVEGTKATGQNAGSAPAKTLNVRHTHSYTGALRQGWALDLDNGVAYVRTNGNWENPVGSNTGIAMKLNTEYRVFLQGSSSIAELVKQGLVKVNLGSQPFEYTLPDGYRPFNDH